MYTATRYVTCLQNVSEFNISLEIRLPLVVVTFKMKCQDSGDVVSCNGSLGGCQVILEAISSNIAQPHLNIILLLDKSRLPVLKYKISTQR